MCRKAHGSAFATYVACAADGFGFTSGADAVSFYESSPRFRRPFCSVCGAVVPGDPAAGRVFMPAGCLDDDPGVRPAAHIFVGSKAPWHEISDELPRFDQFPPGIEGRSATPGSRVPEDGPVQGSCLCGAVAYALRGELQLIVNCHCSRCRKARSAAHGSNLLVRVDQFEWLRGEQHLQSFALSDAEKGFGTCFCTTCGSSLPLVVRNGNVGVPSGSLDVDPGARERIHIFVGSKAPWHTVTDDLPQFEELPPGTE
jgi:hypothetical protein